MPQGKKASAAAPAVVSSGCSSLMSCLSLHRRRGAPDDEAPLQERPSRADAGAEKRWQRVQFLEEEIRKLLAEEEERPAATVRAMSDAKARDHKQSAGNGGGGVQEMAKLEDGGYLHEIRQVGRPWGRLAIQVSRTVLLDDNAAGASEVLDKMTMIKARELCKNLMKTMPMKDIAGRRKPVETVRRTARLNSAEDYMEAVLFKAMDKMEGLVLEGLRIQMASTATDNLTTAAATSGGGKKRLNGTAMAKDCMVHVVLIQVRDPKEGYDAIGDPMIGLMEASLERIGDKVKMEMQGLHIAGISAVTSSDRNDGRGHMWSASLRLRECRAAAASGDGCRCSYVRNPNRVFQR